MKRTGKMLLTAAAIGGGLALTKRYRSVRRGTVTTAVPLWAGANCLVWAQIDGWSVTRADYDRYLTHRIRLVERSLGLSPMATSPAGYMLARLTREKIALGPAVIEERLTSQIHLADQGTNLLLNFSRGRVVTSETRLVVEGITLADFLDFFDRVQGQNSVAIEQINLGVHPDHYLFRALPGDFLEVIEACGSSPLATRMFIRYRPSMMIDVNQARSHDQWRCGTAQLLSGRVQGAVRHQFTPMANGFRAVLRCDFPAATPRMLIRRHEMHLACEFTGWVKALAED